MTLEEDLLNYSLYFKNLPQQTQLMEEGGLEFFNVSKPLSVLTLIYSLPELHYLKSIILVLKM